ncbi:glycosyltransferase [Aquiflexum gelatinilyticum]|uniref:Glycosyltransferase n=1 Tax=Aquiflexum gelatinilyticum TaxID=2961943 RepID=A0A9X2P4Y2_9BACT|nr:glycosyltransferase [Aquiflexum gelatinilyticum]MCR9016073.1 glycosyltransferase [Aquiflexum gelatinilyticum]
MVFSVIIPVYNRPDEIRELLQSLTLQTFTDFEVIVVDDGSDNPCRLTVESFNENLKVRYFWIENIAQGFARNFGMKLAKGDYFVLFDSDCIIPSHYFEVLNKAIKTRKLDAHGGPDAAEEGFSNFQKAINYSMTSVLTTGGIRGKLKDPSKYQARGFNMGLSKKAFEATKGFVDPNRGEDIELSIRLKKMRFRLELVEEAFVYHKRKNTWKTFFRQSYSFGQNRINVSRYHPNAVKLVHLMPAFFLLGWMMVIGLIVIGYWLPTFLFFLTAGFLVYGLWILAVFVHSTFINKSPWVGFLSIFTAFGQLSSYGVGLMTEWVRKVFRG